MRILRRIREVSKGWVPRHFSHCTFTVAKKKRNRCTLEEDNLGVHFAVFSRNVRLQSQLVWGLPASHLVAMGLNFLCAYVHVRMCLDDMFVGAHW